MPNLTEAVANAQAEVVRFRIEDGRMDLNDANNNLIVSFDLPKFSPAVGGQIATLHEVVSFSVKTGTPAQYIAYDPSGVEVFRGKAEEIGLNLRVEEGSRMKLDPYTYTVPHGG